MDIGSSKPSQLQMEAVRHYLIDVVNPDYNFSAGDFCERATIAIHDIHRRGKIPLLVGGTGFYINSFCFGIDDVPEIKETTRIKVASEYDSGNSDLLYEELNRVDPEFALKVHKNDKQRVIRAVSVFRDTGRALSSYFNNKRRNEYLETLFIGISIERESLLKRIDDRVDLMIKKGFVDEVENLRNMGYASSLNSMQSIGYAEINKYIDGIISLKDAVEEIKNNTKRYSKKQMTWFKKNKNVIWFSPGDNKNVSDLIKNWIN